MASPSQFHDPYFGTDQSEQAPNAPLQHDEQYLSGTDITILRPRLSYELLVEGSGTIAYSSAATSSLRFTVTGGDENKPQLWLTIRPQQVLLQAIHSRFEETIPFQWLKTEFAGTLTTGTRTTYWLSIDSQTGLVRYGKHLANKAMTLYQAELTNLKWLREAHDVWVKENGDEDSHLAPVVMPLPVKTDLAPFVITADTISLRELEQGTYTVPAVLPEECRLLFQHVAAPSVVLDSEDFPDFSKAIEHSCTTPGLWAYERLKSKEQANATKDDPKCSYLRFSLGYNWVSESADFEVEDTTTDCFRQNDHGAGGTRTTLILEIWPRGHSSRTRAYGSTFGIMKVSKLSVLLTFGW